MLLIALRALNSLNDLQKFHYLFLEFLQGAKFWLPMSCYETNILYFLEGTKIFKRDFVGLPCFWYEVSDKITNPQVNFQWWDRLASHWEIGSVNADRYEKDIFMTPQARCPRHSICWEDPFVQALRCLLCEKRWCQGGFGPFKDQHLVLSCLDCRMPSRMCTMKKPPYGSFVF